MKRNAKIAAAGTLFVSQLLTPLTAFAQADTGNGVRDILMDDRFEGAMSRITWLTNMVDNWFIQLITVTAFLIISFSLLKNVLAAAYCAFPKFFDSVHEAHEKMKYKDTNLRGLKELGGKFASEGVGTIVMSIIPDVKAFTDFESQDMSPKQYFMKAIPQMCIMVIMGIFIYNGYYRDTAATVGEAGATLVENLLGSVSPEKAVNDIFNMKGEPKNTYKDDKTIEGGYIKTISDEMYKQIKANSVTYKQTSESKEALMRNAEYAAFQMVKGNWGKYAGGVDSNPFAYTAQYQFKMSKPQVFLSSQPSGGYVSTDTSNASRAFRFEVPIEDILGVSPTQADPDLVAKYVIITGNLTPVARSEDTFETAIDAQQGTLVKGANLDAVTITVSEATLTGWGGVMANDSCVFYTNSEGFKTALTQAINDGLATKGTSGQYTLANESITSSGFSMTATAGAGITMAKGTTQSIGQVSYTYTSAAASAEEQPETLTGTTTVIIKWE